MDANQIEPITPENWVEASSALCRAAMTFETLIVKWCEHEPDLMQTVLAQYPDDIHNSSAVVGHWRKFLEITP